MKKIVVPIYLLALIILPGCRKFLDAKPDQKLEVPATLTDFQALLDRYPVMNTSDPAAGEVSGDDYYLLDADYLALTSDTYRNLYTWQKDDLFLPETTNDWFDCYRPVFTANTIIQGLPGIPVSRSNLTVYNNVKGQAYFGRGKAFFNAATLWSKPYNANSAGTDLGVPIRLSTDFNDKSVRASIEGTYQQIISDLKIAANCLPVTPQSPERASRPAAFGMLARVYLAMMDYKNAGLYADSCLQLFNTLLDYNTLNGSAAYPFLKFNAEVIYDAQMVTLAPINNVRARIDTGLYRSYAPNDLRKALFFRVSASNTYVFRGSYEGGITLFDGLATDEILLISAECYAREGEITQAETALNKLLSKRYQTGTYLPVATDDNSILLKYILTERRKELVMRGNRWVDLKRLNAEGAGITLARNVNGGQYILSPNDPRYVLPIPDDIIALTGMPQNPR